MRSPGPGWTPRVGVGAEQPAPFHPVVLGASGNSYVTDSGTHDGNPAADIFAPIGTPIYAPVGGRFEPASYSKGGNAGWLHGDDGRVYYFAHAAEPMFSGGRVEPGQPIGAVGDTGNAKGTSPHLHFSIGSSVSAISERDGSGDIWFDESAWSLDQSTGGAPASTGGAPVAAPRRQKYAPSNPDATPDEVERFVRRAAQERGIDPDVAVRVALGEGGFDTARRGTFDTGSSWWPFQLHYGGAGYEYLGGTAGMGNGFTAQTGFEPGDPAAWAASVEYALDNAAQAGSWAAWYGRVHHGVGVNEGFGNEPVYDPSPQDVGLPTAGKQAGLDPFAPSRPSDAAAAPPSFEQQDVGLVARYIAGTYNKPYAEAVRDVVTGRADPATVQRASQLLQSGELPREVSRLSGLGRQQGWQPGAGGVGRGQDVGVGAGWLPELPGWTPPAVRDVLGLVDEFGQAIGQRLDEIPNFQQNPLGAVGSLASAALLEAPPAAVKYAAGVEIGAMQGVAEGLGLRDGPIDARESLPMIPLSDPRARQIISAAVPGSSFFLPEEDTSPLDLLGSAQRERVLPSTDQAGIFSPTGATQRFEAVAPSPLSTAVDYTAGVPGVGLAGKGIKAAAGALASRLGMDTIKPLGSLPIAQPLQRFSESVLGQRSGLGLTLGTPLVTAGAAAAATPSVDPETGEPLLGGERLMRAGTNAGFGALAGILGVGVGRVAFSAIRSGAIPGLAREMAGDTALSADLLGAYNAGVSTARRGSSAALGYPGGTLADLLDRAGEQLTHSLARFSRVGGWVGKRRESGVAQAEATQALPDLRAALTLAEQARATAGQAFTVADTALSQATLDVTRARKALTDLGRKPPAAAKQSAEAAVAQAKSAEDAAQAAQKAADQTSKAADRARALAERGVQKFESASQKAAGAVPHEEQAAKLAQQLNSTAGQVAQFTEDTRRHALKWNPSGGHGLKPGGRDRDLFNQYRFYKEILQRASRTTDVTDAQGVVTKVPAPLRTKYEDRAGVEQIIDDAASAQTALDDFVRPRLDAGTVARYETTLTKLTERHNEALRQFWQEGYLTDKDYANIINASDVYIRAKQVQTFLDNWAAPVKPGATPMWSTFQPVRRETALDELFTTSLDDALERDRLLLTLVEKNRVGRAWTAGADADPNGFGRNFWIEDLPKATTTLETTVARRDMLVPLTEQTAKDARAAQEITAKAKRHLDQMNAKAAHWQSRSGTAKLGTPAAKQAGQKWALWQGRQQSAHQAHQQALSQSDPLRRSADTLADQLKRARGQAEAAVKDAADDSTKHTVEKGWAMWPVMDPANRGAVRLYKTPKWLYDLGANADATQADAFVKVMGRFGSIWRAGVTTLSLPFLVRNPVRDALTGAQNYPSASRFLEQYIPAFADVSKHASSSVLEDLFGALSRVPNEQLSERLAELALKLGERAAGTTTSQLYRARGGMGALAEQGGMPGFLSNLALLSEMPARVAVFKAEKAIGASDEAAGFAAKTILTDFSKAGKLLRAANLFMPLLNARVQGELQSWDALNRDPMAFAGRLTATVAIPYMVSYLWNRTQFGDLMDSLPTYRQARSIPLIWGKTTNPRTEKVEPRALWIPMNDVAAAVVLPLRYMLDQEYHTQTDSGTPLEPGQRSEWTPQGILKDISAGFIPTGPLPEELSVPGVLSSAMMMNPFYAVGSQIMANHEQFSGQPIVDPDALDLPVEYHQHIRNHDTTLLSEAASQLLHDTGATEGYWAPAQIDFALKGLTGPLMTAPVSTAIDGLLLDLVGFRGAAAKPYDASQLPPEQQEIVWKLLRERQDVRPWLEKSLPFLFSSGGNAQTIIAKAKQDSPTRHAQQRDTLDLQNDRNAYDGSTYRPALRKNFTDPDRLATETHARINNDAIDLARDRRTTFETLRTRTYPKAVVNARERQKYIDALPGIPVGSEFAGSLLGLPPEVNLDEITRRYEMPPGVDPLLWQQMDPLARKQEQKDELQRIAREYTAALGTPIDPNMLSLAISANQRGIEIPALPIPAVFLDDWVDAWRNIDVDYPDATAEERRLRRDVVIQDIAEDHGIAEILEKQDLLEDGQDPNEQAQYVVRNLIQTRMLPVDGMSDLEVSRERAYALSEKIHDPALAPFTDRDGNAVGKPDDWQEWNEQIAYVELAGIPKSRWSPKLRLIDTLRSYAELQKVDLLYSDPDYQEYTRWFGLGRELSPEQWDQVQAGTLPRYRAPDGRSLDGETARTFDWVLAKFRALPAHSPEKARLEPIVRRIRDLAVPKWRNLLDIYELKPEQQRRLDDELLDLRRELQPADDEEFIVGG